MMSDLRQRNGRRHDGWGVKVRKASTNTLTLISPRGKGRHSAAESLPCRAQPNLFTGLPARMIRSSNVKGSRASLPRES
jgi:hypothetical protein